MKEADAPKNWTDLLDPKWKDNIALGHPGFSGYVGTWALTLRNQYGWDFFEKLAKNNPRVGRSINDTVTMLNAGESAIAGSGPVGTLMESAQKGNPLAMIYPTDGTVLIIAPSGIMKGSKHPNAARLFMEFLLSEGASTDLGGSFQRDHPAGSLGGRGRQVGQGREDHPADRRADHQGHTGSHQAVARNLRRLEHDPEKWKPVFRRDHAQERRVTTGVDNVTDNSLDLRAVQFSGLASRIRRLDASILLWLVLIGVLAFLILNPVLRLIVSSLQETDTGRFTLANYLTAYGNIRHLQSLCEFAGARRRRRAAGDLLCRADRLGGVAHRHAGQGVRPAAGVRAPS